MNIETARRLNLARHLYELARTSLESANELHLFSAVNLLQDAVEAFLIAIADHVGAPVDQNTKFDKYFVAVNEKIAPKELPFKNALLRLNRIRVDSKHYGIQPARDECYRLATDVREFFEEVSASLLNASFSTLSVIDLLTEGDSKSALIEARDALQRNNHRECAICCRQAIYLEIEQSFSVEAFKDGQPVGLLSGGWTDAPFYAREKRYIDEHVGDATDYIVYDHNVLDQKLMKQGVDTTAYWNVFRLTPEVYRTKDKRWIVKEDLAKLAPDHLAGNIDYIFSATLDIILSIHRTRQSTKHMAHGSFFLELTQENVPVYKKADKTSEITGHTPPGMTRMDTDYRIEGLAGDGDYWHVMDFPSCPAGGVGWARAAIRRIPEGTAQRVELRQSVGATGSGQQGKFTAVFDGKPTPSHKGSFREQVIEGIKGKRTPVYE